MDKCLTKLDYIVFLLKSTKKTIVISNNFIGNLEDWLSKKD